MGTYKGNSLCCFINGININFKKMTEEEKMERHLEVSDKLLRMSQALQKEGEDNDDETLQITGNLIRLISGIMGVDEDLKTVADLCAMFSAKKILEGMGDSFDDYASSIDKD
jgi:hypothetical protein